MRDRDTSPGRTSTLSRRDLLAAAPALTVAALRGADLHAQTTTASTSGLQPFRIRVPQSTVSRIADRVRSARWPDRLEASDWRYGANWDYMRQLAEYWTSRYDWRRAEAALNALTQFTAPVSGIDLHFVAEGEGVPVLCLHGWPSSVWEFHRLVPRLREDMQVVVPSLPGYGFSFAPGQRRFGVVDMAEAIHALMTEVLGHERYRLVAGDWGASIACRLAYAHPEAVAALHLYMMPLRRPETWPESLADSRAALQAWQLEEGGYGAIQGTRPQTLAYGLSDSPAGLLAWIAEKFEVWTDASLDPGDVLATATIYWATQTIGASFWPYFSRIHGEWVLDDVAAAGERIAAPLTYLDFPRELVHVPREIVETVFTVERWDTPRHGGHFPALEQTELLARSVREFSRSPRS
jgi:microsomal epoxide hydrolase